MDYEKKFKLPRFVTRYALLGSQQPTTANNE
jgi:hypothetical protein